MHHHNTRLRRTGVVIHRVQVNDRACLGVGDVVVAARLEFDHGEYSSGMSGFGVEVRKQVLRNDRTSPPSLYTAPAVDRRHHHPGGPRSG